MLEIAEPVGVKGQAIAFRKAQLWKGNVKHRQQVEIERCVICLIHARNNGKVRNQSGIQPDNPAKCASAGLSAPGNNK